MFNQTKFNKFYEDNKAEMDSILSDLATYFRPMFIEMTENGYSEEQIKNTFTRIMQEAQLNRWTV
jgi:hypothetical protein